MDAQMIATATVAFFSGLAVAALAFKTTSKKRTEQLETERQRILDNATSAAANERQRVLLEAKSTILEERRAAEAEIAADRRTMATRIETLDRREEELQNAQRTIRSAQSNIERAKEQLGQRAQRVATEQSALAERLQTAEDELCRIAALTKDQARDEMFAALQEELEAERGRMILRQQKELSETAPARSRDILLTAIQRFASSHAADTTTSTVDVPTDDVKGRIIGREGRNIRSFEKETGVDVIIDDTPGVVIVSAFDPVRREIARLSLTKLIADGRIHPSKIEETVSQTAGEIDDLILQKGVQAADEVNVCGLNEKVLKMLGRLHFRTSYSQNVLRHSIEVSFIAGMVAEMIGMDASLARRCGLLHDIGKAADHEIEGGHPKIGGDLLQRAGECDEVVHAARGHHDEIICQYPYTMMTATADACSAARPGARRESLERYVKRMEELESIAKRFDGVRQAFAVSAGRELRVIVNSSKTDDEHAAVTCREIAKAFENELTYPGEIKITVVRESRFTETAH